MVAIPFTKTDRGYPEKLSRRDVERLLRDPSAETKIDVLQKVSGHYQPEALTDKERLLAEQIFRLLVRDSAVKIRSALSENLQENPHIPLDIALALAKDSKEEVATPMLSMSSVLSDKDITSIIHNSEEIWRYLAISKRAALSEQVSAALVDTRHAGVIRSVLDNEHAALSENTLEAVMAHARDDKITAEKLASRPSLPVSVVEKLMAVVSGDVAKQLGGQYDLDYEQVSSGAYHAHETSMLDLLSLRHDRTEIERLVMQLYDSNRLSASLVINGLCNGNVEFFEISLARMAGLPVENAQLLIGDKGKLGLSAIYEKSGLPGTMFKAVRLLLLAVRVTLAEGISPGSQNFTNQVIRRMLEMAENEEVENLSYIVALVRQYTARSA